MARSSARRDLVDARVPGVAAAAAGSARRARSGESAASSSLERRPWTRRRGAVTMPSTPRKRRQRRGHDRQPGRQVLVDLHREDARGELVARRRGSAPASAPRRTSGSALVGARPEQVHVRLGAERRDVGARVAGARPVPTSAKDQSRRARASATSSPTSSLVADDRAGEDDPRAPAAPRAPGSTGPASSACANSPVSATFGASSTLSEIWRIRSASGSGRWRARGRRGARSAPRRRGSWPRRCPSGPRCHRRSGRRRATGESTSSSASACGRRTRGTGGHAQPARRTADERTAAGAR